MDCGGMLCQHRQMERKDVWTILRPSKLKCKSEGLIKSGRTTATKVECKTLLPLQVMENLTFNTPNIDYVIRFLYFDNIRSKTIKGHQSNVHCSLLNKLD